MKYSEVEEEEGVMYGKPIPESTMKEKVMTVVIITVFTILPLLHVLF